METRQAVDREESETGVRGPIEVRVERVTHPVMPEDTPKSAQEGAVEVTYETLGDLVQRFHDHTKVIPIHRNTGFIVGVQKEQDKGLLGLKSESRLTRRTADLKRDTRRLRDTMSVEKSELIDSNAGMSRMQKS
ncbi:hypothetical protein Tco_1267655 [Tanacetum coccineum]